MLSQRLIRGGVDVVEIPQDMKNMSPAMKLIEQLMKRGLMTHGVNPVALCWGNGVGWKGEPQTDEEQIKGTHRLDRSHV